MWSNSFKKHHNHHHLHHHQFHKIQHCSAMGRSKGLVLISRAHCFLCHFPSCSTGVVEIVRIIGEIPGSRIQCKVIFTFSATTVVEDMKMTKKNLKLAGVYI